MIPIDHSLVVLLTDKITALTIKHYKFNRYDNNGNITEKFSNDLKTRELLIEILAHVLNQTKEETTERIENYLKALD